jgi:hypothetical protein
LRAVESATGVVRGGLEFLLSKFDPLRSKEYQMAAASNGFPASQSQYAFSVLQAYDPDDTERSLALRCLEERSRDKSEVACRYYWGLFLASGVWGVPRDLERAWQVWRGIRLNDVLPLWMEADFFKLALPPFCEFLAETAESDTDHLTALQYLARFIGDENSDEELRMLLLKKVYLDVRVNMVVTSPDDLEAFLDYYETSDRELCTTIAEKWFAGGSEKETSLVRRLRSFLDSPERQSCAPQSSHV